MQIISLTFIAIQSIPIVSYLPIICARITFEPTPSVDKAILISEERRITLAKYPISISPIPGPFLIALALLIHVNNPPKPSSILISFIAFKSSGLFGIISTCRK